MCPISAIIKMRLLDALSDLNDDEVEWNAKGCATCTTQTAVISHLMLLIAVGCNSKNKKDSEVSVR